MASKQERNEVMEDGDKHKDSRTRTENQETVFLDSDDEAGCVETGGLRLHAPRSVIGSRPPPPFLQKMYDMLENDQVNSVVSWGPTGATFVIRNHHLFSANVLPLYFKHCNFQSFVTQLNSYGFRKTSWEQWEYTNTNFRKGERHLLKNIKRRNQIKHRMEKASETEPSIDKSSSCGGNTEKELEIVMKEHQILKMEIMELKDKQLALEQKIASRNESQQRMIFSALQKMQGDMSTCGGLIVENVKGKRKMEEMSNEPSSCDVVSVEKTRDLISDEKVEMVLDEGESDLIGKTLSWGNIMRALNEKASEPQILKL